MSCAAVAAGSQITEGRKSKKYEKAITGIVIHCAYWHCVLFIGGIGDGELSIEVTLRH